MPQTQSETIFYLDELDVEAEHSRWGFHDPSSSSLPRFLLWGCALLLLLGLLVGIALDGWAFLRENYWAPLLWVVIAFLVYRLKFRARPHLRIGADGLSVRSRSHRAERHIRWDALERVELGDGVVVLRRQQSGPLHLYIPNLSDERIGALRERLTTAADAHGVTVTSD